MIRFFKSLAMAIAAAALALAPIAAGAAPYNKNLGAARGGAKMNVNRGGGGGYKKPNGGNFANNSYRPGNNRPGNGYRPGNNKPDRPNRPNRPNNIVAGNTVVVAPPRRGGGYNGGGYYNNGRYYNGRDRWDDNDNDFLEFVGKTAAITAGVSVVSAVIGSIANDKPDDCQQQVSNGQVYMFCNGVWYQPVQMSGQTRYQVIEPPQY